VLIQIDERVLNDSRWHPLLDVIVSVLQQPGTRHAFDVALLPEVVNSSWLRGATGARASTAEFIRSAARVASHVGLSDAVTLWIDDAYPQSGEIAESTIRIHPLGALTILLQPLYLIVEDESSDGGFVLWIARLLGRDAIRNAYNAGKLMFRHAGGKGQLVKSARALSFGVWPRDNQPILSMRLRAVALLDSDARFPGDRPNQQIADKLTGEVAFVHVLQGRAIENYVPENYARRRLEKDGLRQATDAFFRMPLPQRKHFPLREGFRNRNSEPVQHDRFIGDNDREKQECDHYQNVSPTDWNLFCGGFGTRLADVFQEPGYRCSPGEQSQLDRSQVTELNDLLSRVIRYL
jgi:hypothetical protein